MIRSYLKIRFIRTECPFSFYPFVLSVKVNEDETKGQTKDAVFATPLEESDTLETRMDSRIEEDVAGVKQDATEIKNAAQSFAFYCKVLLLVLPEVQAKTKK